MKKINCIALFLTWVLLSRCGSNIKELPDLAVTDSLLNSKEWVQIKLKPESFCIPVKWQPLNQKFYYYFSYLNNKDENRYFVIAKYDMRKTSVTPLRYLHETYSEALKDTAELFNGYTLKRLNINKNEVYYSEFYTNIRNTKYLTYSMIFTNKGFLYDVSMKGWLNESLRLKNDYTNILSSLVIGNTNIFKKSFPISKIEVVDLSKI